VKRLLPHPVLSLMLSALWLLLVNEISVGSILLGLLFGWAVPLYTTRFWPEAVKIRHPLIVLRFLGVVAFDILIANLAVARRVLGPVGEIHPAFIEMELELRTDIAISLLASTVSLTPGTVSAFLSADRRLLIIHSLHTTDPGGVLATIRGRYEAPLKKVLESC
jgi:multicomponent K+:H+ antiporter subunit E